ncbi:VOC family protein [Cellulomonas fimi]|uniref:VOC family protein n=1 Tax=Cellulomonas fimi TaxID=1708 RepID=UPI00234D9CAB|nr:VOC family protein [Cellulomonas fimi]MDC7120541.1 VOC family protein [Cellulomonas fimi]
MLSDFDAIPVLAVTDLEKARAFYESTLGFASVGDAAEGVMYRSGSGEFLVYPSSFAGTNQATAISFQISADRFDAEVADLRDRGVDFQTFDVPEGTWQDGVLVAGEMKAAWFADPDGNILNVETGAEG